MTMTVTFRLVKETGTPKLRDAGLVDAPVLPRVGDYVSHDKKGVSGVVKSVQFWWPEAGNKVQIEVRLAP